MFGFIGYKEVRAGELNPVSIPRSIVLLSEH